MSQFYLTAIQLALCLSPMAMGIFISMKVFNMPDITTDGSYTLGASVSAILLTAHQPLWLVMVASMLAGSFAGMCTGFIHSRLKIDALLSGILVMTALYSINLMILGRSNLPLIDTDSIFKHFIIQLDEPWNSVLISTNIVVVLMTCLIYLLRTDFGIAMRSAGNNPDMAGSMGVNTDRIKIFGIAMANMLTGLSGSLMAQYQGFADINMGIGIVITGLGSVLIASVMKKWFSLTKIGKQLLLVPLGVIIFQGILAYTLSLGIDPNYLKLVTALFVLLIVAAPAMVQKIKKN